jgi:WD40 repeat protein
VVDLPSDEPTDRVLLSAWRAAGRTVPDRGGAAWRTALATELLRRGRAVPGEAWLPRWTAGAPVNPRLQDVYGLGHLVVATALSRVDGHEAVLCFDQNGVVHTLGRSHTTREMVGQLGVYPDAVFATREGREIVLAVTAEQLRVWDVATGRALTATDPDDRPSRAGRLTSVGFGADLAFTGTSEGHLIVWSVPDGARVATFPAVHEGPVTAVVVGPGETAVSGSAASLACWDLAGPTRAGSSRPVADLRRLDRAFLGASWHAVTVDASGLLQLWPPDGDKPAASYPTEVSGNGGLACTTIDDRPVAVLGGVGVVHFVDLTTGKELGIAETDFDQGVDHVDVSAVDSPHRSVVAARSGSTEGRVDVLDLAVVRDAPTVGDGTRFVALLDADEAGAAGTGDFVAVGNDHRLRRYDSRDGRQIGPAGDVGAFHGHGTRLRCLSVGSRPVAVLTGGRPFTAVNLDDGSHRVLPPSRGGIRIPIRIAAAGTLVAVADYSANLAVWDLATMSPLSTRDGDEPGSVQALALTLVTGRPIVLTGGPDGLLHRRTADDLSPWRDPFEVHSGAITALDTMDIGDHAVAVTASGGEVSTWDVATGSRSGPPLPHLSGVLALKTGTIAGSAVVVTACEDATLRVWDPPTGRVLREAATPGPVTRVVSVSDAGVVLLAGGGLVFLPSTA